MNDTKYGKYIIREAIVKSRNAEIVAPVTHIYSEDFGGVDFSMSYLTISQPFVIEGESHAHDFDQFLCFYGGDPMNLWDFDAEIELFLGEEGEKHIITTTASVHITKGLVHCPLNFKRVGKPFVFMDIILTPEYEKILATS